MKKYLIALAAIATIAGGIFVGPLAADAIAVSWDRPIAGRINPLYILDTVYANVFNATSTTAASNFTLASTSQLSVFKNAYFGGTATSSFSSTGALSLGSPLGVGSGGTGLTSISNGELFYGSSTPNTLAQPSGSGANILFWDNTNSRLGIGTAAPSTLLHVNGTSLLAGTVEMSTTITSGNLGINGIAGTAHITTAPYLIEGSAGVGYRVILGGGTTATVQTAGDNYAAVLIPKTILAEATSGNHPILSALAIRPLNVTSGVATVSTTSTLFIEDAATTTTASGGNFSLYVLHGNSWLNGNVTTNGTLVLPLLKAAAGTFLAVDASGNVIATSTPAVGGSGTVTSVQLSTPNSTLTLGGTNPVTTSGTIQADINLAHANIFSALQSFLNSSTTLASNTGTNWFGKTATTTINADGNGSIVVPSAGSITSAVLGTPAGTFLAADPNGKLIATGTPSGGVTGSGVSGQVSFWSGTTAQSGDTNFVWDNTNKFLGVGSTTPSATLSVSNSSGSALSRLFSVSSSTGAAILDVLGGGNIGIGTTSPFAQLSIQNIPDVVTMASSSVWSTAGTYTWTAPANAAYVVVQAWGGGGGGGSCSAGCGQAGSGGGAGAFVGSTTIDVMGGVNYTLIVGGGGVGGSTTVAGTGGTGYAAGGSGVTGGGSNAGGGGGGSSSFNGPKMIAAGGGGAGYVGDAGQGASGTSGGTGGAGNGTGGAGGGGAGATVGGNGSGTTAGPGGTAASATSGTNGNGFFASSVGGGGGSSAGATGNGANATTITGATGSGGATAGNNGNPSDSGGGGTGVNSNPHVGGNGGIPGGGGGGGVVSAGGTGGGGRVIITTYVYATATKPSLVIQNIINGFNYIIEEIDQFGHLFTGGPSPLCSTGCTSASGDDRTIYAITNAAETTFTILYANAWSKTPWCFVADDAGISGSASSTLTSVTVTLSSLITASHRVGLICQASSNAPY